MTPPGPAGTGGLRARLDRFHRSGPIRRRAILAGAAWIVLVLTYGIGFLSVAAGGQTRGTLFLDAMFFLIALVLPLGLIGLAAWLAEELAHQRAMVASLAELAVPLLGALEATRTTLVEHGPASPQDLQKAVQAAMVGHRGPDLSAPLDRIQAGLEQTQATLRALAAAPEASPTPAPSPTPDPPVSAPPRRTRPAVAAAPAPPPRAAEPALPLLPDSETPPALDWADVIQALDFPRDADDQDGFRALQAALRHHRLAQVLQAAEDVLTLLSQQGLFMDDLEVAPADTAAWRRFIAGTRGTEVATVGGIVDPQPLEIARGLMKDPIFRDTALHFQRRFDAVLADFGTRADDEQLRALADTRSGRAFMLLARLNGCFD